MRKYNPELLKATCQVIGCKPINAHQIASGLFKDINKELNRLASSVEFESHFDYEPGKPITMVSTRNTFFKYLMNKHLEKYRYSKEKYLKDFYIASDLVQNKRHIIVLLAGASGTGKSTLASLLGSRLGIPTVLSTDTIRHIMRNFITKEECPILFASTYETGAYVSPEEGQSEKMRTLLGYK